MIQSDIWVVGAIGGGVFGLCDEYHQAVYVDIDSRLTVRLDALLNFSSKHLVEVTGRLQRMAAAQVDVVVAVGNHCCAHFLIYLMMYVAVKGYLAIP